MEDKRFLEKSDAHSAPVIQWPRLRRMMEDQGLTYPALAKRSGTPESTLRKLMHGSTQDPRISTMIPVVIALNASLDAIVGIKCADQTCDNSTLLRAEQAEHTITRQAAEITDLTAQIAAKDNTLAERKHTEARLSHTVTMQRYLMLGMALAILCLSIWLVA